VRLTFKDKILLGFVWIVKYEEYSTLTALFGISKTVISTLIDKMLPLLASYFIQFIPNKIGSNARTSSLSRRIISIVDSTIHATRRPPTNTSPITAITRGME
jgi:hypothetical protein